MRATSGIGIKALLGTSPPSLFDSDHGPVGPLTGYPGGDRVNGIYLVGTTPVIVSFPQCTTDKCAPSDIFVDTGPTTPPRSLGKAVSVAPGVDKQSVWLLRQETPDSCRLQHVTLTGTELGTAQPAACTTGLREETNHGLLITIDAGAAEHTDALIDPATGRTVQQAPEILGVFGDSMLLNGLGDLTLVNLGNNSRRQLRAPSGGHYPAIAASRDGSMLAIDFADPAWRQTNTQVRDVWLLNLATVQWQHAPGMPYVTENLKIGGLSWSEDGDVVLLDGIFAAWHPGEPAWRLGAADVAAREGFSYVVVD